MRRRGSSDTFSFLLLFELRLAINYLSHLVETLPSVDVKIEDCIDALRLQMIIQTRMIHSHHHSHNIIRINRMWSRQKFHQLVLLPH